YGCGTAQADGGAASQAAAAGRAWLAADSYKTVLGVLRGLDCHKLTQRQRLCAEVPFGSGFDSRGITSPNPSPGTAALADALADAESLRLPPCCPNDPWPPPCAGRGWRSSRCDGSRPAAGPQSPAPAQGGAAALCATRSKPSAAA